MSGAPGRSREVPDEFARALRDLGLTDSRPIFGEPLTGGVSSDIWRIDTAQGPVCAKRALSKLRVAADWQAPIERNVYEARWMQVAHQAVAGSAPRLFGQHRELGVLVMSYLPGHTLWKEQLRQGLADAQTAAAVARTLVRIHAYSAERPELAEDFPSQAIFHAIRLEPYLLATAERHADLADRLQELVRNTQTHALALVHGDVSPKNILIGTPGPVLLDAECAVWGDPAFDIAFCLNHLLLKCVWNPEAGDRFLACFTQLSQTYLSGVEWEPPERLEQRAAQLLPGLLLARVDGKSPVEYITEERQRDPVRRVARRLLRDPPNRLQQIAAAWHEELNR
jgi:aminoglycoside phosphotransferase (APT) family kinase protein